MENTNKLTQRAAKGVKKGKSNQTRKKGTNKTHGAIQECTALLLERDCSTGASYTNGLP